MPFAVELLFDETLEAAVRDIWIALHYAGVDSALQAPSAPHISLVGGETSDLTDLSTLTHEWSRRVEVLEITLSHLGRFPATEVAFLGVTPHRRLLDIHADFHNSVMVSPAHETWNYYQPRLWVPHCTLAQPMPDEDFEKLLKIVAGSHLPLRGKLETIQIVHWEPRKRHGPWPLANS